jgi:TatD DNase family protein
MLDSHCHLNDDKLFPLRKEIVSAAINRGVNVFLIAGWDIESSKKAVQIAHEFPNTYATVGIHPENLDGVNEDTLVEIEHLARDEKVVSIGEIGLDYHWYKEEADHRKQKIWFQKQIALANKMKLPISVHARDAAQDTYEILKTCPVLMKGNLHCYSGPTEMMPQFSQLGYYFGFDGPITYPNSRVPKANVIRCPLERLLSETDSPYLTPVPYRGEMNEPKYIPEIVQMMADLRGCDSEILAKQILINFETLFHVKPNL